MADERAPGMAMQDLRFTIPPRFLEVFAQQPRVVIKWRPDGLWPIDPGMLQRIDWNKLSADEEFKKNFEVVVMAK